MELLLKRNEIGHNKYDLFAKLELKPDEEARFRKAQPETVLIWDDDAGKNTLRWRLCLSRGLSPRCFSLLSLGSSHFLYLADTY